MESKTLGIKRKRSKKRRKNRLILHHHYSSKVLVMISGKLWVLIKFSHRKNQNPLKLAQITLI
jgi:hypothetical protein